MAESEMANFVGFRFHPTDEELVNFFLRNKNLGNESAVKAINEIEICRFDPWDLPWQSKLPSDDRVWFFFCPRVSRFSNSQRISRTTRTGFWKSTGRDRKIRGKRNRNLVIGSKKTLVFYLGRGSKCEKTEWVMHEYQSTFLPLHQRKFVLCKVKDKRDEKTGTSSRKRNESGLASGSNNLPATNTALVINQPVQETPEYFHEHDFSFAELDLLMEAIPEFRNAVQASGPERLTLAELEYPNEITSNNNVQPGWPEGTATSSYNDVQSPSDLLTKPCLEFPTTFENGDKWKWFSGEQFVVQDNNTLEPSVHERRNQYTKLPPVADVYEIYSSNGEAETTSEAGDSSSTRLTHSRLSKSLTVLYSYQEASSPGESIGSSKENCQTPVHGFNGTQNDGSAHALSSTNAGTSRYGRFKPK